MKGYVYSVNIGEKKGEPKKSVKKIVLIKNYGVKGDCHAEEGIKRQVSFLSWERMNEEFFCLKKKDNLKPGIFGENITTQKIDLRKLRVGDRLKIKNVIIEISEIGKNCHSWCSIYKKVGKCLMPKEGVFGVVVKGGEIKKGDVIEVQIRIKVAILTISDSCFAKKREDKSGEYIKERCIRNSWEIINYEIIPDEKEVIKEKLIQFSKNADLILTTGGTGITKRDITPEATREVIEKEIPGISEILRIKSFEKTNFSVLSRGICGVKENTLIINLPGSLNAVIDAFEILENIIIHSIEMIREFPHD